MASLRAARTSLLFTAVLLLQGIAAAQTSSTNDSEEASRWMGGVYLGGGWATVSTPSSEGIFGPTPSTPDDTAVGGTLFANLGYRTLRGNYVEFVLGGWFGTLDGSLGKEEWLLGFFGGAYRVYPWDRNVFVRAGFGASSMTAKLDAVQEDFQDFGIGLLGSVGVDIALSETVYVGPVLDFNYLAVGDDTSAMLISLSLGILWR